jgi:hypothetical protein
MSSREGDKFIFSLGIKVYCQLEKIAPVKKIEQLQNDYVRRDHGLMVLSGQWVNTDCPVR